MVRGAGRVFFPNWFGEITMKMRNRLSRGASRTVRTWIGGSEVEGLERRVLLSAAIAALGNQQTFLSGPNPLAVALGDVNRDGKLDAVVANNTGDTINVLLNDGTG